MTKATVNGQQNGGIHFVYVANAYIVATVVATVSHI